MINPWVALVLLLAGPQEATSAALSTDPATLLVRGGVRAALLAPVEEHVYQATLRVDEYLEVVIAQEEIDVTVRVEDPAGRLLAEIDNPYGRDVPETVALVAAVEGAYRLVVKPFHSATVAGRYRLAITGWRAATETDRLRTAAEQATHAAHRQADLRTDEGLRAAAEGYQAARTLWCQLGDRADEARLVRRLGQTYRRLGAYEEAEAALDDALVLARGVGRAAEAATVNELGILYRRRGDHAQSIEAFRRALVLWRELGDASHAARVHNNLAVALQAIGEPVSALKHYQHALERSRELGDRLREATTLINLGHLHNQLGALDQAVAAYEQARPLLVGLERKDLEADLLQQLGATHDQLGELHAALESHSEALEVYRHLGDQRRQAAALASQGRLLVDLGLPAEARQRLTAASALLRSHRDPLLESRVLLSLGAAARDLGELGRALDWFSRAREVARQGEDRDAEAMALYHQGVVRLRLGDAEAAHDLAAKALALFHTIGNAQGEVIARRTIGRIAAARGDDEVARRAFERALAQAERMGDVTEQARCRQALGRLARDRDRWDAAWGHLEAALADFESVRARISGEALRASHFEGVREAYELAMDVLMQQHWERPDVGFDRRAYALSQRARARGLFDALHSTGIEVEAANSDWRARELQLRRTLNTLAVRHRQGDERGLEERIAALTAEYRVLEGRRTMLPRSTLAEFASNGPVAPSLDDVVVLLGADTVALEVILGDVRSYLWVVAEDVFSCFELPGRAVIESLAERVHRLLGQPGGDRAKRDDVLRRLSQVMLGPALGQLARGRWVIVADGGLHQVPFAALPVPRLDAGAASSPDVPLMLEHEVVVAPSMAVIAAQRRRERVQPLGRLALLADPVYGRNDPRHQAAPASDTTAAQSGGDTLVRLTGSDREADAIAEVVGAEGLLTMKGFDANRTRVLADDLGAHRIVHFATHGVVDLEYPALSGLALSRYDAAGNVQESFLRLHDIYPLRWQAELVVLSGCQTAFGRAVRGEGLMGLARGFLHAGATQVVASLWSVRDQATAELMRRFYQSLIHQGLSPAAALAVAQRGLWRERRWRDPYFWAAFVVMGDWRMVEPHS